MSKKKNKVKHWKGISYYFDKKRNYGRAYMYLPNGERKDFYGRTEVEAKDKAEEFRNNNYINLNIKNYTLADCSREFLNIKKKRQDIKASTYNTYEARFKKLENTELFKTKINKIDVKDLNNFFEKWNEKYSKAIIRFDRNIIRWGFDYAKAIKMITYSPLDDKILINFYFNNKKKKDVKGLPPSKLKEVLQVINNDFENLYPCSAIWLFMIYTGARVGEVCALQWKDINTDNKTIHIKNTVTTGSFSNNEVSKKLTIGTVKKEASNRIINYSYFPKIDELINIAYERKYLYSDFVFFNSNGNFLYPSFITNRLKKLCKDNDINVDISSHILRHTCSNYLQHNGFPDFFVSYQLGHSSPIITKSIYEDYNDEESRKILKQQGEFWNNF